MYDYEPTVRSRQLGYSLTVIMQKAGFNARKLAHKLHWDPSRMSRLLSGKRGVKQTDLAAFLAVCDVVGPARDDLLEMAKGAWDPIWLQQFGECLPVHLSTLSFLHDTASAMIHADCGFVPALLQTESYMRALLQAQPVIPGEETDPWIAQGLLRQQVFDREPQARFEFFIHEYALTRTGPGRQAMSDQVHHLLRMTVRPHVEIRVVPEACGLQGAFKPFQILEFDEFNPVVYVEHLNTVVFVERKDTVTTYRNILAALDGVALDEHASRAWLGETAADLARTDYDEPADPDPS